MIGARDARNVSRTLVLNAAGADAGCGVSAGRCSVTGSSGYQVLVWGDGSTLGAAFQLDTWNLWSAAGPAKECTTVPSTAYGFGPYTGTLSPSAPALCLVTTRRQNDDLNQVVSNPVSFSDGFTTGLYTVTSSGMQACAADGEGRFTCPKARTRSNRPCTC